MTLRRTGNPRCGDRPGPLDIFKAACQTSIAAQSDGGEPTRVPKPSSGGVAKGGRIQSGRRGDAFAWPSLIRKFGRLDASYKE